MYVCVCVCVCVMGVKCARPIHQHDQSFTSRRSFFMDGECIRVGEGPARVMRTGGTDSSNAGEYGSLDYSAESRYEEKRENMRACYQLLGCWTPVKGWFLV